MELLEFLLFIAFSAVVLAFFNSVFYGYFYVYFDRIGNSLELLVLYSSHGSSIMIKEEQCCYWLKFVHVFNKNNRLIYVYMPKNKFDCLSEDLKYSLNIPISQDDDSFNDLDTNILVSKYSCDKQLSENVTSLIKKMMTVVEKKNWWVKYNFIGCSKFLLFRYIIKEVL